MKVISIGDIHGRTIWKRIVENHLDVDKIIFIGDYLDTHEDISPVEQLRNLEDIIEFKNQHRDKVTLLIGNHDFHYWPGVTEHYSGYNYHMRPSFEQVFKQNRDCFQMCDLIDHVLYTHAGVTKTWVKAVGIEGLSIKQGINDLFDYQPRKFYFYPYDSSDTGNNIHQSPIWVRPESLYKDKIKVMQVVGHTQVSKISHPPKSERRGFYVIDCLAQRQYLSHTDGVFNIEQLDK